MKELLGKQEATDDEIEEIREIIIDTGALSYAREKAEEFYRRSEKYLDEANPAFDDEMKKYLIEIAKMGVHRVK